ncbi:uncharacterized protein LOC125898208 [Epinephelus fuscoguttatus]|uniref:uncharacterized protein LOC125898208 n=1 Tax=Epinephelus fuscoguttatus TaxID=293821 RepID=UPI0020D0472F|nr:uncharacterized protein LOC125898208 [Epinephelus fuscoguttatus]XP_049447899.1 uncharacterized protein LOC125898208 [Epinephelus fuscoguttatus]XP_049447900.1 uncharacterized protein LOC125898208 [Epinephelus fuscoguttatus]XP_049447901.1 uncharacterized protein LOC125898208 [Epinephelus fuscoguttatus]XP_049447902.1 uncharacterized protein LOC125898208 [Epinephelus fuscoguttatus]
MLVLLWLLILMMTMMMKSDAASAEIVTARSGGAVLLTPPLQTPRNRQDVRWTHPRLVMSLKKNVTTCHHGRCELLSDGSLSFSRVQSDDSGSYSLEVFDQDGTRLLKKDFLLTVEDPSSSSSSSSSSVVVSVLVCCFLLLLLLFIIFFILRRRRRSQGTNPTGPLEENVYVTMHGHHGNKGKAIEEKQESHYVPCHPVVSMETPITEQMSEDVEDVYV